MTLGEMIKGLRLAKGLTQYQLAKKTGITDSYLSKIENNHIGPGEYGSGKKLLRKLADIFSDGDCYEADRLYAKFCFLAGHTPELMEEFHRANIDEALQKYEEIYYERSKEEDSEKKQKERVAIMRNKVRKGIIEERMK